MFRNGMDSNIPSGAVTHVAIIGRSTTLVQTSDVSAQALPSDPRRNELASNHNRQRLPRRSELQGAFASSVAEGVGSQRSDPRDVAGMPRAYR